MDREKVKTRKPSVLEGQAAVDMALLKAAEGLKYMERLINTNMHEDVIEGQKLSPLPLFQHAALTV